MPKFIKRITATKFTYPLQTAPVSGFARSFLSWAPLQDATITILEKGTQLKTDSNGLFGPFQWPVGEPLTLVLEKEGYQTTQTATITVPPEGLNEPFHNISFQVPSDFAVSLFTYAMGVSVDKNACTIAATITAFNKTMLDVPQGEADAKAVLSPSSEVKPFYFGIFESGLFKHKTNPFNRNLTETSMDGGVIYINIPPRDEPYTLTAVKEGVCFNQVTFFARRGVFVNLSPPLGPTVQQNSIRR